jgi:hypothetical protein
MATRAVTADRLARAEVPSALWVRLDAWQPGRYVPASPAAALAGPQRPPRQRQMERTGSEKASALT